MWKLKCSFRYKLGCSRLEDDMLTFYQFSIPVICYYICYLKTTKDLFALIILFNYTFLPYVLLRSSENWGRIKRENWEEKDKHSFHSCLRIFCQIQFYCQWFSSSYLIVSSRYPISTTNVSDVWNYFGVFTKITCIFVF